MKAAEEEGKPATYDYVEQDSGYMKDWTLVQIEGEEAVDPAAAEDPKAKGKAPAKGKGGDKSALEEITDHRPREIKFVKDFVEEAAPVKFTEDLAKFFEGYILKFEIWDTNRETLEEKFLESH